MPPAPRGKLILYGINGGNDTAFPACAAFKKHLQFFRHCVLDFTGFAQKFGSVLSYIRLAATPADLHQEPGRAGMAGLMRTVSLDVIPPGRGFRAPPSRRFIPGLKS